jgi:hypothetical protein
MAYTALTVLTADRDGISIADAALTDAVAGGHKFVNDGQTVLYLQNTNGAARTVTVQTAIAVDTLVYNQSDGTVLVDYSATAGVKVAAVKIPKEMIS